MRVLIWTDEAYDGIPGGHRVQIDSTIAGLRELSVEVRLADTADASLDGVDLVHSFGARAAWTRRARHAGIPVVISPVYWSQSYVFGIETPRPWRERLGAAGGGVVS